MTRQLTPAIGLLTGMAFGLSVYGFALWLAPRWNPFDSAATRALHVGTMSSPKVAGGDRGLEP